MHNAVTNFLDTASKRARHFKQTSDRHAVWIGVSGNRGGVSLGYRPRKQQPGTWSAKLVTNGIRRETLLGIADDPGAETVGLSYTAAITAALAWATSLRSVLQSTSDASTVGDALVAYCDMREARSLRCGKDARLRLSKYVACDTRLTATRLARLTAGQLKAWRGQLHGLRPSGINRLLNDLRACLTAAMPSQVLPIELKAALRGLRDATEARPAQVLSESDIRQIVHAAGDVDAAFGRLVMVMAATGARFSQLMRMTVGDVQITQRRVLVPASRKGSGVKPRQSIAFPVGADVLTALEPIVRGRNTSESLLLRRDGEAWATASEMTERWKRTMQQCGLPISVTPYALRSSSIVRMLAAGIAVRFVAQLHDTSTAMIEKHYNRYVTDEVESAARRAIVPVVTVAV